MTDGNGSGSSGTRPVTSGAEKRTGARSSNRGSGRHAAVPAKRSPRPSSNGGNGSSPATGDTRVATGLPSTAAPRPTAMTKTIVLSPEHAPGMLEDGASARPGAALPTDLRFRLARVGPWSVFKLSVVFAAGTALLLLGAFALLYFVLQSVGVLSSIEKVVNQYGIGHHFRFDAGWIFTRLGWALAFMAVVGSLFVTCLAVFYNAVSDAVGGLDVSFEPSDREDRRVWKARQERVAPRRAPRRVVRMGGILLRMPGGQAREEVPRASGF